MQSRPAWTSTESGSFKFPLGGIYSLAFSYPGCFRSAPVTGALPYRKVTELRLEKLEFMLRGLHGRA